MTDSVDAAVRARRSGLLWRTAREIPVKPSPDMALRMVGRQTIDLRSLALAREAAVDGGVRFDGAAIAMYANDASNFHQVPIGVVIPRTLDDVVTTHGICAELGAPICNRGDGTSPSGETVNYALIVDSSKHLTAMGPTDVERRLEICTYEGGRFWVGVDTEKDLDPIVAAAGRKGQIYGALRARQRARALPRKAPTVVDGDVLTTSPEPQRYGRRPPSALRFTSSAKSFHSWRCRSFSVRAADRTWCRKSSTSRWNRSQAA